LLQFLENALQVGLKGNEIHGGRIGIAESGSIGGGEEATHGIASWAGAFVLGEEWQHIAANQSTGLSRVMGGTGDPHGIDCGGREPPSVRRPGGSLEQAPVTSQFATGAPAENNVRMRLQVTATPVPHPKPEEDGGWGQLNKWKPDLLLWRHEAGGSPPA